MKRPASASASPGLHCRNDTLTYRDTTAWVLPGSDQMRVFWQPIAKLSQAETRLFASILTTAALLLAFGLLAEEVIEGETLPFDRKLLLALRQAGNPGVPIGPPWLPEAARDISALGSTIVLGILLLAVVGYLLMVRRRAAAWLMLGAVLSGVALNTFLKFSFARPRPDLVTPLARVVTASFPSGHATMSAITYLTLGALLARTHSEISLRIYFMALAGLLTVLVGLSRIYLGVHYPTDVLAGWCIGTAWAMGSFDRALIL